MKTLFKVAKTTILVVGVYILVKAAVASAIDDAFLEGKFG
jgi:hypothetical protein